MRRVHHWATREGAYKLAIDGVLRERVEVELQRLHAHAFDRNSGVKQGVSDVVRAAVHERQRVRVERWRAVCC